MIPHVPIAMVAGCLQHHQQQVITYLQEENRVLKAHLSYKADDACKTGGAIPG